METKYKRLTLQERFKIEKYLALSWSISQIAFHLNRNKSSISREVKRAKNGVYDAFESHQSSVRSSSSKNYGRSKIKKNKLLSLLIKLYLKKKWSPEQISLFLSSFFSNYEELQVSHETIYNYVYLHTESNLKKELIANLRQARKTRGPRHTSSVRDIKISDRISIDERPQEVEDRGTPGHWEGDLIVGKDNKSAIGTLVERSSRAVILVYLKDKKSETVRKAFEKEFNKLPEVMKKSLTYDNGTEMAQHKTFTKNTKVKVYFTHPYSPWERPTNENTNGLLRQYFPKGEDLSVYSKAYLKKVQRELNERPRKTLNMYSPAQVFNQLIVEKMYQ